MLTDTLGSAMVKIRNWTRRKRQRVRSGRCMMVEEGSKLKKNLPWRNGSVENGKVGKMRKV